MINMDFMAGISEISKFFPRFKPTDNQIIAWYDRLKDFSGDAMRIAVYEISETLDKSVPSYQDLKRELITAEKRLIRVSDRIPTAQGFAPMTDEKEALVRKSLKQLNGIVSSNISNEERKELAEIASYQWDEAYALLPKYLDESQVQRLIDSEQWDRLVEMGFMQEPPQFEKPFVPPFSSEKYRDLI